MAFFDWLRGTKQDRQRTPRYTLELRVASACFPDDPIKAHSMQRSLRHVSDNVMETISRTFDRYPDYADSLKDIFHGFLKHGRTSKMQSHGDSCLFTLAAVIPVFDSVIPTEDEHDEGITKTHRVLKTAIASMLTLQLTPAMGDRRYVSDNDKSLLLTGQTFVILLHIPDPETMMFPHQYWADSTERVLDSYSPEDLRWIGENVERLTLLTPFLHERGITTRQDMEPLLTVPSLPLVDGQL
jgi:hypothetical protein